MVEMSELREAMRSVGERGLVLGDELCAGTESASAVAIVGAAIEYFKDKGCAFMFATHLHELPPMEGVTIKHMHVTYGADGRIVFDRVLRDGVGSSLYGLEVCGSLGMSEEFMRKAYAIRDRFGGGVSKYNADFYREGACMLCGRGRIQEVHHIVPQCTGERGMNRMNNLVGLCEACHLSVHRGETVIKGWRMSSEGVFLDVDDSMMNKNNNTNLEKAESVLALRKEKKLSIKAIADEVGLSVYAVRKMLKAHAVGL